ncbi:autotransporter domain-containing protein [Bradyrhizobium australiense]|uniref:Autotransporter outer membrane beta-barrel domain-containing protein n=1 Tax=Bradyrhizobium australiense TaxID=2721161 RepID=A0A7Y4GXI6_9BRAD|nr:autotransporter domain-containing protein [Bradyrhizobium australiense]NOJ43553.1 autotransporter outer membrane beta-barrel domain-containing protein [Bradyrhizobium australiense]
MTRCAAAQAASFNLQRYGERAIVSAPQFVLNYASQTATATRNEFGLRTDKTLALQGKTLPGIAAGAHDYDLDRGVPVLFQAPPGTSFVVNGARSDSDAALAKVEARWLNGFSPAGTFELCRQGQPVELVE